MSSFAGTREAYECKKVHIDTIYVLHVLLSSFLPHSFPSSTLIADLGTLRLSNAFHEGRAGRDEKVIFDMMHFEMKDLKLSRARLDEDLGSNAIVADCLIVRPISFELDIREVKWDDCRTEPKKAHCWYRRIHKFQDSEFDQVKSYS